MSGSGILLVCFAADLAIMYVIGHITRVLFIHAAKLVLYIIICLLW